MKPLVDSRCQLGEGPLWDPETGTLHWLDIDGRRLWSWSADAGPRSLDLPIRMTSLARTGSHRLVGGAELGFAFLDPHTGAIEPIDLPQGSPVGTLMNDGKCDRSGRLVAGSKVVVGDRPIACAFLHEPTRTVPIVDGLTVWNGPAFDATGERIYFADSPTRRIMTARWDGTAPRLWELEIFAHLTEAEGYPDGMTVDAEGCLWNARWDGWSVVRHLPDGSVERKIDLPVPRPTSVAFGGADLRTLFVTSARVDLDYETLARAPDSGGLFALKPGVAGLAEPVWG
jgi:sugar lactone lactonase YvrE